jgi:Fungal specific transcription factor domain
VSLVASGKHTLDKTATDLARQLGSGFRQLHPLCLIDEVWKVIEATCEITVAVDHHHRGGPSAPSSVDIISARNTTQHRLLSLPEYPLQPPSHANYMYEICRVAALTYSNIVIFPLPPASGLHTNLVSRLKQLLNYTITSCPDAHLHVILWALTLGGISTGSSSERVWFLYKFAEASTKLGLFQWSRIQECLASLLWLDFVMEKEGVQLWLGARELIHHDHKVVYPEPI